MKLVGRGFAFEDLKLGFRFRTHRRTITEADRATFIGLSWLTEELFAVDEEGKKRLVPGALVYSFAEGLLLPTMQDTGLAFLNATLDVKAPTMVGDTIHVESEVIEHRLASTGERGLVRFAAEVIKIEPPGEGDPLRKWRRMRNGVSLWWQVQSRNKKSVTCDLRRAEGQEIVRRLARKADLVVENFR